MKRSRGFVDDGNPPTSLIFSKLFTTPITQWIAHTAYCKFMRVAPHEIASVA